MLVRIMGLAYHASSRLTNEMAHFESYNTSDPQQPAAILGANGIMPPIVIETQNLGALVGSVITDQVGNWYVDQSFDFNPLPSTYTTVSGTGQAFGPVPATPVPSTNASGGTIANGVYGVEISYVYASGGETLPSANGPVTTTGTGISTITVPSPPASPGATGWYAYVTQVNGATFTRQQTAGSPTAIGTGLTLTAPPTSTGANPLTTGTLNVVSTAGFAATGSISVAGVGGYMPYTGLTATSFTGLTLGLGSAINGGAVIQYNGTGNWDYVAATGATSVNVGSGLNDAGGNGVKILAPYMQVRYINGATPQTYMRLFVRAFGTKTG